MTTQEEILNQLQSARECGNVTPTFSPVAFRADLDGPDGAFFTLFRESHHSPRDIAKAKAFLLWQDDVTGFRVISV